MALEDGEKGREEEARARLQQGSREEEEGDEVRQGGLEAADEAEEGEQGEAAEEAPRCSDWGRRRRLLFASTPVPRNRPDVPGDLGDFVPQHLVKQTHKFLFPIVTS